MKKLLPAQWRPLAYMAIGFVTGVAVSTGGWVLAQSQDTPPLSRGPVMAELRRLTDGFVRIKTNFIREVTDAELVNACLDGMTSGLDPDSSFIGPEEFKEMTVNPASRRAGVGLELRKSGHATMVVGVIDGNPGMLAGIRAGDIIGKIDGVIVNGKTLNDVIMRLRGDADTTVRLTIVRDGTALPLEFEVQRKQIVLPGVESRRLEGSLAYIKIPRFEESTGGQVSAALRAMFAAGPVQGIVLDLRHNAGGLLNAVVGVAAVFLPADAVIMSMDGRTPEVKATFRARRTDYLLDRRATDYARDVPDAVKAVPMTVLVDGFTAAGSEIVAGALQDHKRAVVVGETTFGRGSLQTILPLSPSPAGLTALKLTTATWQTPAGRLIAPDGITPDVAASNASADAAAGGGGDTDTVLQKAQEILRKG